MTHDLTSDQLDELAEKWRQANDPATRQRHFDAEWRRVYREVVPLRTRTRVAAQQQLTRIGIWLLDHDHDRLAVALWRAFGMI